MTDMNVASQMFKFFILQLVAFGTCRLAAAQIPYFGISRSVTVSEFVWKNVRPAEPTLSVSSDAISKQVQFNIMAIPKYQYAASGNRF